ncbi:MAG: hypothetical protein K2L88_06085 [Clostridiales bacterium]|nr:hypothetical protein [Clostridiales bacterium]
MNGAEIVLLVVLCVAFAVALGIIIYNLVKGKSCCGDCEGCSGCHAKKKNSDSAGSGNGKCPHCTACLHDHAAAQDKDNK